MTTCPFSFEHADASKRIGIPAEEDFPAEKDWNHFTEEERVEALASLAKLRKIWDTQEPRPKRLEKPKKVEKVCGGGLNPLRWEPPE
jgi:hypothetical protein